MSIDAAHDEDFLAELHRAGCRGVLIGFESLDEDNLKLMNKRFNTMKSGFRGALENLRRHRIFVYGTFIFGYEHDTHALVRRSGRFCHRGGDVHRGVQSPDAVSRHAALQTIGERRAAAVSKRGGSILNIATTRYRFEPKSLTPDEVTAGCVAARRRFYGWPNILRRSTRHMNDGFVFRNFFLVNALHRNEISQRNGYPLGDENWRGKLLEVQ